MGAGLLALSAYCFYLPLGIMGPLVTSRAFKQSFSRAPPPLSLQLVGEAGLGIARYGLWFLVTEVSTYITFQQALAYHVSVLGSVHAAFLTETCPSHTWSPSCRCGRCAGWVTPWASSST